MIKNLTAKFMLNLNAFIYSLNRIMFYKSQLCNISVKSL